MFSGHGGSRRGILQPRRRQRGRRGSLLRLESGGNHRILGTQAARLLGAYQVREEATTSKTTDRGRKNILHWKGDPPAEPPSSIEQARRTLFAVREKRPRPQRDDKVLTDWNGLTLAALAKASVAFGDARYGEAYRRCLSFFSGTMLRNGVLLHRWRDSEAAIGAHLDDYAFLIWGLIEGYQAFLDPSSCDSTPSSEQDAILDDRLGDTFFLP